MLALRVAQKIYCSSRKNILFNLKKYKFHRSSVLRWQTPDELSTSELRRECDRRKLSTKGSRNALIERLKEILIKFGGYDNGLTLDNNLANKKRKIESELNKIPDNNYSTIYLFVEERFQKKIINKFNNDSRIKFYNDQQSHICLEGKYSDICYLRNEITKYVSNKLQSKETIYSLPHNIILKLKRSILADIKKQFNVNFTIMRHKHNGQDMMLIAIDCDDDENRVNACDMLEDVISKIKSQSSEQVPGLENYNNDSNDCFNVFNGITLYLDPRMREMMQDYQSRLDQIGIDTNCNIYLGNRDLFWLNDFQLGIEGDNNNNIKLARKEIDLLINHLKSLTMTLVLPPSININNDISKESKNLALTIQKDLGVDTVIIQQNDYIYIHLIGSNEQINIAASIIDSRTHNLNKIYGIDNERLLRRERIKTLNFIDYGVGGLDDTLRDMLRRTFESRLISSRLRKELDLQHIRGVLLYGPPGTGKTLIARKISEILGCDKPKIVNGPEVESKWVGEAEKNIRNLFEEAQAEFDEKGEDNSSLHVIIFDEIDAIAKKRGGAHAKSRDGALNQLLCCLDGIELLDNILVFGLTNRKDCLDPALLRPGRLEVQLDIGLPDIKGRYDILNIHTKTMKKYGRLDNNVDLQILAQMSDDFSGADIAGMIRSAVSFALENIDDEDQVIITQELLQKGLHEIRFARERLPTDDDQDHESNNYPGLLQA